MQDIFNLSNTSENLQVFTINGSTAWQVWSKPRNVSFVNITCIGAGGSGGAGQIGIAARTGGGGGGSGSISSVLFPANLIPDILYINVGVGGASPTSGNNGAAGLATYVSIQPNTTVNNILFIGNAGGGGTAAGGGGTAGGVVGGNSAYVSYLGVTSSNAGQVGGAGGASTGGAGVSITPIYPLTSGAGGGGATSGSTVLGNGGSIIGVGIIPTINGGVTGGTLNGVNGFVSQIPSLNSSVKFPLLFTGGAGGASGGATTGGAGGNGGYGCGGGGGGAGSTGGAGGRGGDGLVIITTW